MRTVGDAVVVSRCELFAQELSSSTDLFQAVLEGLSLIPTNLPWLAGIASSFSKWRWIKLVVKYYPVCSTTQQGAVGYGFGYDMAETTSTTLGQISAFDQFKLHAPWTTDEEGISLDVGRFSRDWYPYIGRVPYIALTGVDQNIYSPAYLTTFTGASASPGVLIGSYFIDYIVELADPISPEKQPS